MTDARTRQRAREAERVRAAEAFAAAAARFFRSEDGEVILEGLKARHYFYDSTFVPGDRDATIHREGQRQVVLDLLALRESLQERG